MKGIVLAGDSGARLHPLTLGDPKQLLPIYDRPMIFYPIETLKEAGVIDILIITTSDQQAAFKKYLGNGSKLNVSLSYAIQDDPKGIAEAVTIGRDFLGKDDVCLITGDTIILGYNFSSQLKKAFRAVEKSGNASIFVSLDLDANQYGKVVNNIVVGNSADNYYHSITGLYVFPHNAVEKVKQVEVSDRGLLEITSLSKIFQDEEKLQIHELPSDCKWLDTNSFDSLLNCGLHVKAQLKKYNFHNI